MSEKGIVRVSKTDLANWKAQIDQAHETYMSNKQKIESVISSIRGGDMKGDPATAFLNAYEKVEAFIGVEIPKKFVEASNYIEEQIHQLGVTVDNIQSATKW